MQEQRLTISDRALAQIRADLDAPPPAQRIWNNALHIDERKTLCTIAGAPEDFAYRRWQSIHEIYQLKIRQQVRRWANFAEQFRGVF